MNFDKSSYEVREDSDVVMIMIVLNQPSSKPFDVILKSAGNTTNGEYLKICFHKILKSAEDNDYLGSFGVVNIPANEASKLFTIHIINYRTAEYNETFTLTVYHPHLVELLEEVLILV